LPASLAQPESTTPNAARPATYLDMRMCFLLGLVVSG
jgi:hypothetical protein